MRSPDRVLTGDIVCPLILASLESTHISADSYTLILKYFWIYNVFSYRIIYYILRELLKPPHKIKVHLDSEQILLGF